MAYSGKKTKHEQMNRQTVLYISTT